MKASDFFSIPGSMPFADHFDPDGLPWEWIAAIKSALASMKRDQIPSDLPSGVHIEGAVFIHETVTLPANCTITGPAWIGRDVEIRPGAYIRGNVIIGAGSVIGNSCEYKNALLLENTQTPHFSYIGDSVLGKGAHLGAGVILSNLRLDQNPIKAEVDGRKVNTGLRKFGALLGDNAEVGCNSVLMPGSILGKRSLVGPLSSFKGTLAAETIYLEKNESRAIARLD